MKAVKPKLELVGVIVTQYNGRTTLNKAVLDALQEQAKIYHSAVLQPPIRRTIAAEEWQYTGDIYGDKSTASEDYTQIVQQLPKLLKLKGRKDNGKQIQDRISADSQGQLEERYAGGGACDSIGVCVCRLRECVRGDAYEGQP